MSKAKAETNALDLFDEPTTPPSSAPPGPQVHRKELTKPLRHCFSPEMRASLADEMAHAVIARDNPEDDLKAVSHHYKSKIAGVLGTPQTH